MPKDSSGTRLLNHGGRRDRGLCFTRHFSHNSYACWNGMVLVCIRNNPTHQLDGEDGERCGLVFFGMLISFEKKEKEKLEGSAPRKRSRKQ